MTTDLKKTNSLEKKLFEIICLIQAAIMGYAGVQSVIFVGFTFISIIDFVVALQGLLFFYLSKQKKLTGLLIGPYILFLIVALIFFWFNY
jgi:hypothetical protein